jgi:CheY-like chemotaxis protein
MPVMNGFEATRAIRSFERGRSKSNKPCKIIALTGLSSTLDEAEALNSGMDLFLTKPVAFKEVKKILERWNETKLGGEGGLKPLGDSA